MLCENCIHENVCQYKAEFENLKNDIAKVAPTWAPDRYLITIECKNFSRGTSFRGRLLTTTNFPEVTD